MPYLNKAFLFKLKLIAFPLCFRAQAFRNIQRVYSHTHQCVANTGKFNIWFNIRFGQQKWQNTKQRLRWKFYTPIKHCAKGETRNTKTTTIIISKATNHNFIDERHIGRHTFQSIQSYLFIRETYLSSLVYNRLLLHRHYGTYIFSA